MTRQGRRRVNWRHLLFGFHGRINRAKFWLSIVVLIAAMTSIIVAILVTLPPGVAAVALWLAMIAALYVGTATAAKRLHDRDRNAGWMAVFFGAPAVLESIAASGIEAIGPALSFTAVAITAWALVELGFLRGTAGATRFGPDPLAAAPGDAGM